MPGRSAGILPRAVVGPSLALQRPGGLVVGVRSGSLARGLCLCAVVAVLVLVTLPRLRAFALEENEGDARALLGMIGASGVVLAAEPGTPIAELPMRGRSLATETGRARNLRGGAQLRLHGYLFDLVSSSEGPVLRAWPFEHGRTGHGAFVLTADGALLANVNASGRWSGEVGAPGGPFTEAAGWRPIPRDADWR